jgi:hypothetical protein
MKLNPAISASLIGAEAYPNEDAASNARHSSFFAHSQSSDVIILGFCGVAEGLLTRKDAAAIARGILRLIGEEKEEKKENIQEK